MAESETAESGDEINVPEAGSPTSSAASTELVDKHGEEVKKSETPPQEQPRGLSESAGASDDSGKSGEGEPSESLPEQNGDEVVKGGAEEEEEETCGFCKYMKGGGCKAEFVAWMECVDTEKETGGDYVEQCIPPMQALRECMLANPDYYGPMLEEEESRMNEEQEGEGREETETEQVSSNDAGKSHGDAVVVNVDSSGSTKSEPTRATVQSGGS